MDGAYEYTHSEPKSWEIIEKFNRWNRLSCEVIWCELYTEPIIVPGVAEVPSYRYSSLWFIMDARLYCVSALYPGFLSHLINWKIRFNGRVQYTLYWIKGRVGAKRDSSNERYNLISNGLWTTQYTGRPFDSYSAPPSFNIIACTAQTAQFMIFAKVTDILLWLQCVLSTYELNSTWQKMIDRFIWGLAAVATKNRSQWNLLWPEWNLWGKQLDN